MKEKIKELKEKEPERLIEFGLCPECENELFYQEGRTIDAKRENISKFVKKWGNAVYESNKKRTKNNYVFPKVKISAFGLK